MLSLRAFSNNRNGSGSGGKQTQRATQQDVFGDIEMFFEANRKRTDSGMLSSFNCENKK